MVVGGLGAAVGWGGGGGGGREEGGMGDGCVCVTRLGWHSPHADRRVYIKSKERVGVVGLCVGKQNPRAERPFRKKGKKIGTN